MKTTFFRGAAALLLAALMCLGCAAPAFASQDTPAAVTDARNGVLRIISLDSRSGSAWTGSGFAIGTEDKLYVATNSHVVEGCDLFYVYYDTGKYIEATIVLDDPSRDLCILEPASRIPRVQILQLETDPFDTGGAVWALGFPAAADLFAQGEGRTYNDVNEFLGDVIADKQSMSITNGIISAMHDSVLIGDSSRQVRTIQTNAALNGGNSGGPLLNREGRVVGVNTMVINIADAMNGAVHVDELITILKEARIKYEGTPEPEVSSAPVVKDTGPDTLVIVIIAFFAVVVIGGIIAVVLVVRSHKKNPIKGGIKLAEYDKSYRKLGDAAACAMAIAFIDELLPLTRYDINPLLTPDNIVVGDSQIALLETTSAKPAGAKIEIYPGYSAPENYQDMAGQPSAVYFIGALLVTVTTGKRPPEALGRKQKNAPMFDAPNALQNVVNHAMEPYEQNRLQDLYQLRDMLAQATPAIQAESYYGQGGQPPQPPPPQPPQQNPQGGYYGR